MNVDENFMCRALTLARKGVGCTSPNPCVGAVVVKNGRVLGEGWHRSVGGPHAEIVALEEAGNAARSATLYITLEPCCTWGRTPPCTDAILLSGIRRVVVGATDPNPRHHGRGFQRLQRGGLRVTRGVLERECEDLNRAWNHWIVERTPWVIAKWAMSLDGKMATTTGESRWISSPQSRRRAHEFRSHADAVLVGIETLLSDDPALNVRLPGYAGRQPRRIVLDHWARTPLGSRVMRDKRARPWIFVGPAAPHGAVRKLEAAGARIFRMPKAYDLDFVLKALGREEITRLLVEGGGRILGSFFLQKRVHEARVFMAPMVLGGAKARKAVAGAGVARWRDSVALGHIDLQKVGCDLLATGRIQA